MTDIQQGGRKASSVKAADVKGLGCRVGGQES